MTGKESAAYKQEIIKLLAVIDSSETLCKIYDCVYRLFLKSPFARQP